MKSIIANVTDVKISKDGSLFIKAEHKGTPIGKQLQDDIDGNNINPNSLKFKTIKASSKSVSSLKASEGYSALIGSPRNRIVSTESYGNFIVGSTTFTAHPENIRMGGVFRFNGQITSTMPSTIVTPMPVLKFDFPLSDTLKTLSNILSEYQSFIGGL